MAKSKKNRYTKQAKKKGFMHNMSAGLDTKGNVKNTLLETGKDLLIGVIGGGVAGAAIGKGSLAIGAVVTGMGHFTNNKMISVFGVGMMAANGFQKSSSVGGLDGMDGVKERLQAYKETFAQKLFLDKLKSKKAATTEGFGNVQYFNYNNEMNGGLEALDYIENQISEAGMQQMQIAGNDFEMGDFEMGEYETSNLSGDEVIL